MGPKVLERRLGEVTTKRLKAGWDNRCLEKTLNALNIVTTKSLAIIKKRAVSLTQVEVVFSTPLTSL
jgi:hypothetical protein